ASCCVPFSRRAKIRVMGALPSTLGGVDGTVSPKVSTHESEAPSGCDGAVVTHAGLPTLALRRHQSYGTENICPLSPPMYTASCPRAGDELRSLRSCVMS